MTELVAVPWWVWAVIWVGLVLALLVMLGSFAWLLFRKAMTVMGALAELADRGALDVPESEHVRPAIAVLAAARDIRDREEARKRHRLDRRETRLNLRLERARSITALDNAAKTSVVEHARERFDHTRAPRQRASD